MRKVILFGLLVGAVVVACESKTPVGPSSVTVEQATTTGTACTYTLSPASGSVSAAGGSGTITVVTQTGCRWTVENFANWVTVEPSSERTGSGQILYTAAATTATRETTIVVAGLPFLLRQDLTAAPPTTTTIGATSVTRRYIGTSANPALPNDMTLALNLVTANGVLDTLLEGLPLIGKLSTYSVSGFYRTGNGGGGTVRGNLDGTLDNGTFTGSMAFEAAGCSAGREYSGQLTATNLTWTGGRIIQDCKDSPFSFSTLTMVTAGTLPPTTTIPTTTAPGCTYSLNPGNASIGLPGGSGSVQVVTQPGCGWSAQSVVNWITVSPASGAGGSGSVQYTVQASSAPREATLIIAGLPFVLRQEPPSTTTTTSTTTTPTTTSSSTTTALACSYSLSPPSVTIPASGGSGSVTLITQTQCAWSVQNFANWVTVQPAGGTGTGQVQYVVAPTVAAREATVVIGGLPFVVRQDAAPDLVPYSPLGGATPDYCRAQGGIFYAGVRNAGVGTAGASMTRVVFDDGEGSSVITQPTPGLAPGQPTDVQFTLPSFCSYGCYVAITVDSLGQVPERNSTDPSTETAETNNVVPRTQCYFYLGSTAARPGLR